MRVLRLLIFPLLFLPGASCDVFQGDGLPSPPPPPAQIADTAKTIFFDGQSNILGQPELSLLLTRDSIRDSGADILYWYEERGEGSWIPMAGYDTLSKFLPTRLEEYNVPTNQYSDRVGIGPGELLVSKVSKNHSIHIRVIKPALGGASIGHWGILGSRWRYLVRNVPKAIDSLETSGLALGPSLYVFGQGESDCTSGAAALSHRNDLHSFLERLFNQEWFLPGSKVVLIKLSNETWKPSAYSARKNTVNRGIDSVAALFPSVYTIHPDSLSTSSDTTTLYDTPKLHYSWETMDAIANELLIYW